MGGSSEQNVMTALAKIALQHTKMIPAGVHMVVDFRTLLGPCLGYRDGRLVHRGYRPPVALRILPRTVSAPPTRSRAAFS